MIARLTLAACLAAFAGSALAAADIEVVSGVKTAAFRKAVIAPPKVEFDRHFIEDAKGLRGSTQRYTASELDQIARDMAESYRAAIAEAFRRRGFEVAQGPGNDVLRVEATLRNVYVNAPKGARTGEARFIARDAGRATMLVEAADGSGRAILHGKREGAAGQTAGWHARANAFNRASFERMFREWADDVALAMTQDR